MYIYTCKSEQVSSSVEEEMMGGCGRRQAPQEGICFELDPYRSGDGRLVRSAQQFYLLSSPLQSFVLGVDREGKAQVRFGVLMTTEHLQSPN